MLESVSDAVAESHHAAQEALPFDDKRDLEAAQRGLVVPLEGPLVLDGDGRSVWDAGSYGFLEGENPGTVHPSLWRQSGLVAQAGLYQVAEGIFQVRGLDLSNITFVEGGRGVIVIDPLISTETAAAALRLYRSQRGERGPVQLVQRQDQNDRERDGPDHPGGRDGGPSVERGQAGLSHDGPEHQPACRGEQHQREDRQVVARAEVDLQHPGADGGEPGDEHQRERPTGPVGGALEVPEGRPVADLDAVRQLGQQRP